MSPKKNKRKKHKLSYGNKRLIKGNVTPEIFSIDTGSEFTKALQYHQSGQLRRAEEIYKRILEINPNHSDSLHLLGVIAHQSGKNDIALNLINKAVQCNPLDPVYYNNLGNVLKQQCKLTEAISSFQKALELKPDLAEAHYNLGNIFKDQGKLIEAVSYYQKALEIKPGYFEVYYSLGIVFTDQGKLYEAITCFQKALEIKPDLAEVYNNMGNVFKGLGKLEDAISCFQKALKLKPDLVVAYYNLGVVFNDQGNLVEAISSYQKALEIKPDYTEAYNNMGNVFKDQGKLDEAVSCFQKALELNPHVAEVYNNMGNVFKDQGKSAEAAFYFQKALEIKPNYAEAYNNIGNVFIDQSNLTEAVSCFQRALEIKPDLAEAYNNMGNALKDQGKLIEAITSYRKALEIKPDYAEAYSMLFFQLQQTCEWRKLEDMTAKLDEFTTKALENGTKTAEAPFVSLARDTDLSRHFEISKSWSRDIDKAMSALKIHFSFDGIRSHKSKIIIGYLSNDFRNHAMAHLTLSLYGLHNRDKFKVFCYSYGEDDGSYHRTRILQDCDKFVDLYGLNHVDAAKCIYEDRVNILVDLKGHTRGSRLEISALRPAPIRIRYLGPPCTTGADFIDYIITDRIAMPEDHARYYSEKFAYLPHCYQINDHTQAISNKDWGKTDFGLPEDSFVFCSFNQGYKIEPVMFNTWMNILQQVPKGVLWLQRGSEITEENLRQEAEDRGVKSTRLIFSDKLPKDRHLGRLRVAGVALDTRIVNGIITTSDALWAGVPVITLQGNDFASRVSSSILTAIGLPELIAKTLGEYEFLAIELARNPNKLQMIQQKIMKNRLVEPLFDTPGFVRNLEKSYKEMWKIFVTGEKPRQIDVV